MPRPVEATIQRATTQLVHLQTAGREIVTTPEHPFAVVSRGWVRAGQLEVGDWLVSGERAPTQVTSLRVEELDAPTAVFNLTIAASHAYFVGAQRLLVHNANCGAASDAARARDGKRKNDDEAQRERSSLTRTESELHRKIAEQGTRVRETVRRELGHYDELSRVLAQAYRDGRAAPDPKAIERFDKLNEAVDNVQLLLLQANAMNDMEELRHSTKTLTALKDVKQAGRAVIAQDGGVVLPLIREIDTLNYIVHSRLDELGKGYMTENDDGVRFCFSHACREATPESLKADYHLASDGLRLDIEHARAQTKIETAMLTLLGAALIAETQAKEAGLGKGVRNFFGSKRGAERRKEKSADKRRDEIEQRVGDWYEASSEGGNLNLTVKPETPGNMTIPGLAARLDQTLATEKPRYVGRAVRAAVERSQDFDLTKRREGGKVRDGVEVSAETYTRLGLSREELESITPRDRLIRAGLAANESIRVNEVKFALTRDARESIEAEFQKANSWRNLTPGLTQEKMAILSRTIDVIVLCKDGDQMLQAIQEAQRQHDALLREWRLGSGGATAQTLARWAATVRNANL